MIDQGAPLLDHDVLNALNTVIGERLQRSLGVEEPLPANLQRLMQALAAADENQF